MRLPPRGANLSGFVPVGSTEKRAWAGANLCMFVLVFRDISQGPLNGGGVQTGGVSRSGLVLPFLSFFVLFGTSRLFWDFPDLLGDGPGDFPDLSFSSFSAY